MVNIDLINAVESFASLMLPVKEKELEHEWVWKDHDEEGIRFTFFVTIQELRQLAVQITANRKLATQAQHILGQYHKQYMDLQSAVFGLSDEDSERPPADGEWPIRQIYAHILGAELGFTGVVSYALEGHRSGNWRPQRMSDEVETRIIGMSQDGCKTLMRGSLIDLMAFHREFHRGVIDKFSSISDAELDLPSTFWEETRFPIRHRLHRYEAHFIQHTVQIDKTLAAIGLAPGESKRLIRYLFAALAEVNAKLIGDNNPQEGCLHLANTINSRIIEIRSLLENQNGRSAF